MSPPPTPHPQSGISGLSFHSLYYLLSCSSLLSPVTLSVLSFVLPAGPFASLFFQKILQCFLLGDRLFCMAPVQKPGEGSWWVVFVACCYMALVFAVTHLYSLGFFIPLPPPPIGGYIGITLSICHPVHVSDYVCMVSPEPLNHFFYQTWYGSVLS